MRKRHVDSATFVRLGRAGLAALALVILSVSLAEAEFGPRTTIGNNYQQWSSTQSGNGIDLSNCSFNSCYVLFQPIPQQQPLIVQHVACRVSVSAGGLRTVVLVTRKGQTFPDRFTPLVPVNTTGGFWAVNSPAMHLLKSGERPSVFFANGANADWSVDCSISGKLQ